MTRGTEAFTSSSSKSSRDYSYFGYSDIKRSGTTRLRSSADSSLALRHDSTFQHTWLSLGCRVRFLMPNSTFSAGDCAHERMLTSVNSLGADLPVHNKTYLRRNRYFKLDPGVARLAGSTTTTQKQPGESAQQRGRHGKKGKRKAEPGTGAQAGPSSAFPSSANHPPLTGFPINLQALRSGPATRATALRFQRWVGPSPRCVTNPTWATDTLRCTENSATDPSRRAEPAAFVCAMFRR